LGRAWVRMEEAISRPMTTGVCSILPMGIDGVVGVAGTMVMVMRVITRMVMVMRVIITMLVV